MIDFRSFDEFFNFFWNIFNSKTVKISNITVQSYKAIQWFPISEYLSRFITYAPSFIFPGGLSLEYALIEYT